MIGFKITHNNKTTTVGLKEGISSIIISRGFYPDQGRDECDLHVGGMDSNTQQHCKWIKADLKVNDRLEIEVVDTNEIDKPFEWSARMTKEELLQHKLKAYNGLKKELESEGVL